MTNAFIVEEVKEEGLVRLLQEEEGLEATTTDCGTSRNLKVSNHNKKEEKA